MICKNCYTENPDGAVHCKRCGRLLDERPVCPSCGQKNEEDAVFCTQCGKRLDGATVCPKCETPFYGNFCPRCGSPADGVKKPAAKTATASKWSWRKIVELCGGIFAMCAVFVVLLCTFLLGVSGNEMGGSNNIYYYFKEIYDDIELLLAFYDSYSSAFEVSVYLPAVCETVIAAGTLLSVFVLSVLAVVRYGLKVSGKSEKDYAKYTIGAVAAFVLGCALFATLEWVSVTARDASESFSMRVGLNGAGIAGIACGAVFLGLFLACRVSVKGKDLLTKQNVMRIGFSLVSLLFLALVTAFAVCPGYFNKFRLTSYLVKGNFGVNFFYVGQAVAEEEGGYFALATVTQFVQIALVVLGTVAIFSRLSGLISEKQKSGLALSIPLAAVSIVYLVLAIVTVNLCDEIIAANMDLILGNLIGTYFDEYKIVYAFPIVALIFALMNLAVSSVQTALNRKAK